MVYLGTSGHYFNINSDNEPYLQLGLIASACVNEILL